MNWCTQVVGNLIAPVLLRSSISLSDRRCDLKVHAYGLLLFTYVQIRKDGDLNCQRMQNFLM